MLSYTCVKYFVDLMYQVDTSNCIFSNENTIPLFVSVFVVDVGCLDCTWILVHWWGLSLFLLGGSEFFWWGKLSLFSVCGFWRSMFSPFLGS